MSKARTLANYLNNDAPVIIVKQVNESVTNSTTLQDDNDFTFAVEPNTIYKFESELQFENDSAVDAKIFLQGPVSANISQYRTLSTYANPGSSGHARTGMGSVSNFDSFDSDMTRNTQPTAIQVPSASFYPVYTRFEGFIATSITAGNVIFQWAQATANANPLILEANSWMSFTRIGER